MGAVSCIGKTDGTFGASSGKKIRPYDSYFISSLTPFTFFTSIFHRSGTVRFDDPSGVNYKHIPIHAKGTCNDVFASVNVSDIILTGDVTCVGQLDGTFGLNGDLVYIHPYTSYIVSIRSERRDLEVMY